MEARLTQDVRMQGKDHSTLATALGAGGLVGFLYGMLDAAWAWAGTSAEIGTAQGLGCSAAVVFQYLLLGFVVAALASLACALFLPRWFAQGRAERAAAIGFALFLFVELWWRTRPVLFYGTPALSPQRLAASAGLLLVAAFVGRHAGPALVRFARPRALAAAASIGAIGLCGAFYLAARGSGLGERGAIAPTNADAPNVLLVVVDALRQDTLGCYGHATVKSPHIDALAREGVVFDNHHTQAPFTWTSFGSTLTGKYPRRHGLVRMEPGRRMLPNTTLASWLKSAPKKGGGAFRAEDWLAATFHTGTLSTGSGLLRGFDVYYEEFAGHDLVVVGDAWSQFRSDVLLWIMQTKLEQKVSGGVPATSQAWLAEHGDRRFFAMVHLYSTHTPYEPEPEFRRMYEDPAYDGPVKAFYSAHREMIERGEAKPTAADVAQIRNLYYAGVSQADAQIGALVETLRAKGVLDHTLVVVTSDHGESLGEQGLWEHNHMVQTNLRIPLVMRLPGKLPAGKRVGALTETIDILPTVCELVGAEVPASAEPREMVDGASLLPLVRGETAELRPYAYCENGLWAVVRGPRWKLWVPARELGSDTLLDPRSPVRARLYDLQADPGEDRDLLAAEPAVAAELLRELRAWDARMPIPKDEVLLSPREIEALKARFGALGYAEGVGGETQR